MARKFKIGDQVKIVKSIGTEPHFYKKGRRGKVIRYVGGLYPYRVRLHCSHGSAELGFGAKELELVS